MKDIIFYSLYRDSSFNSLKHCLLYFDKLYLPTGSFSLGELDPESSSSPFYDMNLLPEEILEEVQFLIDEGLLEILEAKQNEVNPDIEKIYNFIGRQLNKYGYPRKYDPSEGISLLESLNVRLASNLSDPETLGILQQVSAMVAAFCLQQMAFEKKIACLDHAIIFDQVSLGLQGIVENEQVGAALQRAGFHSYKANLLAHELLCLHLPSFDFCSFDDVLELREKLRDEIKEFQVAVNTFALEIEKSPLDNDFQGYLKIFIENKINPQIEELKKKLRLSPSSFINHVWKSPFVYASLVGSVHHLLPDRITELAILGSAITLGEEIRKELLARKEAATNGLSLLLKV